MYNTKLCTTECWISEGTSRSDKECVMFQYFELNEARDRTSNSVQSKE